MQDFQTYQRKFRDEHRANNLEDWLLDGNIDVFVYFEPTTNLYVVEATIEAGVAGSTRGVRLIRKKGMERIS